MEFINDKTRLILEEIFVKYFFLLPSHVVYRKKEF